MTELTPREKTALILSCISLRYDDYLKVKEMPKMTLRQVESETGFGISFIRKCREISKSL